MALKAGIYKVTAGSGKIFVYTYKEGFLSAVAHDLLIGANEFTVNIDVPTDGSQPKVEAEIQARSLKVICAMKNGEQNVDALKEKDKTDIDENIVKDVLHPLKHPTINFRSSSIQERDGGYCVKGELILHGVTQPVEFDLKTTSGKDFKGKMRLLQKDYGIKPFKALLGTLKVKNEIDVAFDLALS